MGRVQTGVFDNLIRRLYSIKGGGSELSETLGDVFPILDLENLPSELLVLRGWDLGMGRIHNVSAVGTTNVHQLFNPAGSGKLVVITSLFWNSTALTEALIGPAFAALATTSVAGTKRDLRAGVIKPTTSLLQEEDAAASSEFMRLISPVTTQGELSEQNGIAVLSPGTALRISTTATNTNFRTSWLWRERIAEPSELSF